MVNSSGNSGHNVEYVLRLADWMRDSLPDIADDHLYTIEFHIQRIVKEKNLCIKSMMKDEKCSKHSPSVIKDIAREEKESESDDVSSDNESTSNTSDYSSKVLNKKLRCVKV